MSSLLKSLGAVSLVAVLQAVGASAQAPSVVAATDATIVATFHAEGAQIYECKVDFSNRSPTQIRALTWQLREPIATLMVDGKSVGRHYAGPSWDHVDGSGVKGKVAVSAPGTTSKDIPWLRLDGVDRHGDGILSGVTTIERINTRGGLAHGPCKSAGNYLSVPYAADYVFLRKSD